MRFSTKQLLNASIVAALCGSATPAIAQYDPIETIAERKVIAILDAGQNFGTTKRCVSFYDVTTLNYNTTTQNYDTFNQQPMFSVWTGYEDDSTNNYEDPGAITVNFANGNVYIVAFDSGTAGSVEDVDSVAGNSDNDDTQGDYDLYEINYADILRDWIENQSSVKGKLYGPTIGPDGTANPDHPDAGTSTIHINAIAKIGELARTQGSSFFDYDVEFVRPDRMIFLDNEELSTGDDETRDHEVRVWVRRSDGNQAANSTFGVDEGGWRLPVSTNEDWESYTGKLVNLDFNTSTGLVDGLSEPVDISYTRKTDDMATIEGVWLGEADGGGDDIVFCQVDQWATWTNGNLATTQPAMSYRSFDKGSGIDDAFSLDNTPNWAGQDLEGHDSEPIAGFASDNDGHVDWVIADNTADPTVVGDSGSPVMFGESGFNDAPQHEPRHTGLYPDDYDSSGNILILTPASNWETFAGTIGVTNDQDGKMPVAGGAIATRVDVVIPGPAVVDEDDDNEVTDGRFVAFDTARKLIWKADIDSGGQPTVIADIYAFDLTTGENVYGELDCVNHFVERHGIRYFLRGDINGDGQIDSADRTILEQHDTETTGAIEDEWYDLTGDGEVTNADLLEFDEIDS